MKKIKLTQGKFALIDDKDFELINQYKWQTHQKNGIFYAVRYITIRSQNKRENIKRKRRVIRMHRIIMENKSKKQLNKYDQVDHKNHNGLDNRRINLRICSNQQNCANQNKQQGTSSRYKGVCFHKQHNKWASKITVNYKQIYLGLFHSELDAAEAYNKKASELFGKFAKLNKVGECIEV